MGDRRHDRRTVGILDGEVQQPFGEPPLQVEPDEVLRQGFLRQHLPRHRAEQVHRDRGLRLDDRREGIPAKSPDAGVFQAQHRGRPRCARQDPELAEQPHGLQHRLQLGLASGETVETSSRPSSKMNTSVDGSPCIVTYERAR